VWENLDIFGRLYDIPRARRAEQIERFLRMFDLWVLRNREFGTLSAGQATRVMLAKAFIPQPRVVLLDEPTASLDPDSAEDVRTFILERQKEQGICVLFTSHNMDEVTELCDRVLVMDSGNIIADNTPLELAASVSNAHVHFIMVDGLKRTASYAQEKDLSYDLAQRSITIEIDEHKIAQMLTDLAHIGVNYSSISIEKPTLRDYFLSIARAKKEAITAKGDLL
jgi:ABC-2 type transport system ATP-binding protein